MRIRINGADADIQLEAEKNIGEVLSALGSWLEGTGHRLSGVGVNGETVGAGSIEACFGADVAGVEILDVYTSPIAELFAECLLRVAEDIDAYEAADFEERGLLAARWGESPAAGMLAEQSPDLFNWATRTFSGEGSGPRALRVAVEERLRELRSPANELDRAGALVADVCARLEELPLDIQTGKDARAAETAGVFSCVAEKVFRIYGALKNMGFPVGKIKVGETPVDDYIAEFHGTLQELLGAYERRDTVLVGDLAEYEMAPRLRGLHAAVLDAVKGNFQ